MTDTEAKAISLAVMAKYHRSYGIWLTPENRDAVAAALIAAMGDSVPTEIETVRVTASGLARAVFSETTADVLSLLRRGL